MCCNWWKELEAELSLGKYLQGLDSDLFKPLVGFMTIISSEKLKYWLNIHIFSNVIGLIIVLRIQNS